MANLKDFIKKLDSEVYSTEEQNSALDQIEKTVLEVKQRQELPIEQNDELTQLTLAHIQQKKQQQESMVQTVDLIVSALKTVEEKLQTQLTEVRQQIPLKGNDGEKGRDGRDGKDGYAGKDGKDGVDGKDGKDGSDGVSVSDAKVDFDGSLVITLSDGREIDAGMVLSVDAAKHIHSVQTGGTGSTSQAVLDAIAAIQATIATYGTMATQNANAVAITGGTINGTTIGATTPAAGTFTTITGQTEVLKGTGQNLFRNTNNFSGWGVNGGTLTLSVATTDPFGGTNVYKLVANNGESPTFSGNDILSNSGTTLSAGATYTQSIYIKAAEFSAMGIRSNTSGNIFTFTIGSTPTGNAEFINPALTSVGSGWYRASWSFIAGTIGSTGRSDNWSFRLASTGDGTSGIYVSAPQLEYGTILDPYIVNTTSTAIYGVPSISFAGVSSIALDNLGNLSLQPAGTGALQAQATTSSTVGGNARGANAVDWQTLRNLSSQVSSGTYSVIGGGATNTSSGYSSTVSGGTANGGSGTYSYIGGGYLNNATLANSVVSGGYQNTVNGYLNFVGGGQFNSGTSGSVITTQSGTMNGTTAVTLSGSNANIKVGQLITGTSINTFPHTYVAAISGTSLTLSQAASGSSTSTLSFYTPHGVVVGGGNNQATGSYSFIGGGGDAGTAANRNVASGDWSTVAGGYANIASGLGAFIGGGGVYNAGQNFGNTASGQSSVIAGGAYNTATASYGSVLGGLRNNATGQYSSVFNGFGGTSRGIQGNAVFVGSYNTVTGDNQAAILVLTKQTTDATASALTWGGGAASGTNQVILPNNSAYFFRGEVISGVTGGGNTKGWFIEGVIKRGANAASTALVGTPTVTSLYADAGAATWALAVTADTTNGGIKVTFTGQAATTIRVVAQLRTTEMTY